MPVSAALVALTFFAASAQSAAADPRLVTVQYNAGKVVPVRGRLGYQSMIEFGEGEKIENVAVGDSADWQVTPNRRANLLFLKPLKSGAKTNMTVVTDRRVYLFDLTVAAVGQTPLYSMRFAGNDTGAAQMAKARTASPAALLDEKLAWTPSAQLSGKFNFDWQAKGKKSLLPVRTFDDGQSVYLLWAKGTPLPALLVRGADGKETPVNTRKSGAFVVVDQVPPRLMMRHGKESAVLIKRSPSKRTVAQGAR